MRNVFKVKSVKDAILAKRLMNNGTIWDMLDDASQEMLKRAEEAGFVQAYNRMAEIHKCKHAFFGFGGGVYFINPNTQIVIEENGKQIDANGKGKLNDLVGNLETLLNERRELVKTFQTLYETGFARSEIASLLNISDDIIHHMLVTSI